MSHGTVAVYSAMLCGALLAISPLAAVAQDNPPPPAEAAAGAPPPAVVGANVNLRQGPGTTYTVITLIPAGAPVSVAGCNAGWCQVSFQGQNGYIIATAIAPPGGPSGPSGPPPGAVAGGPVYVGGGPPPGYIPPPPPYYYGYPYYGPYGYYRPGPYWRGGYYYHRRW